MLEQKMWVSDCNKVIKEAGNEAASKTYSSMDSMKLVIDSLVDRWVWWNSTLRDQVESVKPGCCPWHHGLQRFIRRWVVGGKQRRFTISKSEGPMSQGQFVIWPPNLKSIGGQFRVLISGKEDAERRITWVKKVILWTPIEEGEIRDDSVLVIVVNFTTDDNEDVTPVIALKKTPSLAPPLHPRIDSDKR
ncbi:hypothetical protein Tco_1458872 [Tanacetum coccineum]